MNQDSYLVTVIIPAFDEASVIRQAIESALKQEVPLEIIVINDGSTDQIDEVMRTYGRLPNVRYIRNNRNEGIAAARNLGVRLAKSEYIAFLDADDWWKPQKLRRQISFMKKTNTVMSVTGYEIATRAGELTDKEIKVPIKITYDMIMRENMILCSSVVLKREVALEFPMPDAKMQGDYLTWIRILEKYGCACGLGDALTIKRQSKHKINPKGIQEAGTLFRVYRKAGISFPKACYYYGRQEAAKRLPFARQK